MARQCETSLSLVAVGVSIPLAAIARKSNARGVPAFRPLSPLFRDGGKSSPASQTENRDRVVNNPLRLTSARARARARKRKRAEASRCRAPSLLFVLSHRAIPRAE